ncbi:hypothetical protein ACA910_004836 [Epithemia clementina (nom. ined.)]
MKTIAVYHKVMPVKIATVLGRCFWHFMHKVQSSNKQLRQECKSSNDTLTHEASFKVVTKKARIDEDVIAAPNSAIACMDPPWRQMIGFQQIIREEVESTATESAVKHDKASIPIHLWNDRLAFLLNIVTLEQRHLQAFDMLRKVMMRK